MSNRGWLATASYVLLSAIVLAITLSVMFCSVARAHSWYEASCCSGTDCQPVPDSDVEETAQGVIVKGFGTLSPSDSRLRWSRDQQTHICAQGSKLNCVYRKPPST